MSTSIDSLMSLKKEDGEEQPSPIHETFVKEETIGHDKKDGAEEPPLQVKESSSIEASLPESKPLLNELHSDSVQLQSTELDIILQSPTLTSSEEDLPSSAIIGVVGHYGGVDDFARKERHELALAQNLSLNTCKKNCLKFLTILPLILDPLNIYFFFLSLCVARDYFFEETDITDETAEAFFTFLLGTASCLAYMCDMTLANPMEEAETVGSENNYQLNDYRLTELLSLIESERTRRAIKSLSIFNLAVANTTYVISATSGAIALAQLTSMTGIRWFIGSISTMNGIIFNNMIGREKINEHALVFIRSLTKPKNIIIGIVKSPSMSLEVTLRIFANSLYAAVALGYTMEQLLKNVFELDSKKDNDTITGFVLYAGCAAFYVNLFFKSLNIYNKLFDPEFNRISAEVLHNIKIPRISKLFDTAMVITRVGSVSVLIYKNGPSNIPLNIFLTSCVGTFVLILTSHARYNYRRNRCAADLLLVTNPAMRMSQSSREEDLISEKIFDQISVKFKTRGIKRSVNIIVSGTIFASSCAFLGFLSSLNNILESNGYSKFDFIDLICFQQLWGNTSLEVDAAFYNDLMVENLSYYRTKIYLEMEKPHFGFLKSALCSKSQYPVNYLKSFLEEENKSAAPAVLPQFNRYRSISQTPDAERTLSQETDPINFSSQKLDIKDKKL